jgi:uncharacterized protein YggT (Ycf19 family)
MREVHDHPAEPERTVERRTVEQHTTERDPATYRVDRTEYVEPAVEQTRVVEGDPYAGRRGATEKWVQAIHLVAGVVVGLIGIRFVLKALGANPNADFGYFIYAITEPLVAPFAGLFGTPAANGVVIEPQSLIAMVVYALLGWLIGRLIWLATGETRSGRVRTTTHQER